MIKPVGENTVTFCRGEAGHGLEAARKVGSGLEDGGINNFLRNASNKKRLQDVGPKVLVLGEVSKQLWEVTQRHVRPSVCLSAQNSWIPTGRIPVKNDTGDSLYSLAVGRFVVKIRQK